MRALFSDMDPSATRRRLLLFAALLLTGICLTAALVSRAPAQTLGEQLQATRGQLDRVHASSSSLTATIAEQNREIDSMIGEVSKLRQRQASLEAELSAKQSELERATARLAAERRRLARIRARLQRALGVLRDRLVAIYESGSPEMVNVVLSSASWSDVTTRTVYLNQIQGYDNSVAGRVKGLREEAREAVRRMAAARLEIKRARDAIAAMEREAAAARAAAEARFAKLKAAQGERRSALESLESREQALNDNLAAISSQLESAAAPPAPAAAPAPLSPGESAEYISESQASVPSGAPPAVRAAIEAANAIATTPYIWGGGHGSFESPGYDCSGAVSYALHGGGFLESPLDSTGLETWGEPGPGRWITVYANAEHAWMIIAGLAFDTVAAPGPRWHPSPVDSPAGFIARHPSGY